MVAGILEHSPNAEARLMCALAPLPALPPVAVTNIKVLAVGQL
jgi:hypothetical protein